ncbi:MAG: bifunctional phosphoribosylaminoimidazolecarboxamide formyltransferase/IMP cyclohydrolase [Spirochaetaceae bacterium]|jgi:phosphoribosylaminoimidazolecarboxamide formyltransferase/IMP cyclohydrolase|nr:bifunctional phosphoribosylaminoimidazolecarboxamide formyltransferase/IMP cyclohydrolase [Spirochaetaceae bacterium]
MKRALISVFNKEGILDLAARLSGAGWEILSTGGTSKYLRENKIPVTDVASVTGFPECLDGRVKTLHPAVHAGLLARRDEKSHRAALEKLGIGTIDLVCVNLYPFFEKARAGLSLEETIEFIDIGGPAMLRSAAKNYRDVIVLTDPADYAALTGGLDNPGLSGSFRKRLAGKVFDLTSAYDAAVARYLLGMDPPEPAGPLAGSAEPSESPAGEAAAETEDEPYPEFWPLALKKSGKLRYGENGHQSAALYLSTGGAGSLGAIEQLGGKDLGYNNIRDLDLAWKTVCAFGFPPERKLPAGEETLRRLGIAEGGGFPVCCVAVKHNTPCGAALGTTPAGAYEKTYSCDPVSIFGGVVAFNAPVDPATASRLAELFLEIIAAPDFDPGALEILRGKKNLRILKMGRAPRDHTECISVDGGLLVQETDRKLLEKWDPVTAAAPDPGDLADMVFGMRLVGYVKSNAIAVIKDRSVPGIGGGQTNRIWAAEQALSRSAAAIKAAAENPALAGTAFADGKPARVLASDAFFPFPDVVEAAAAAGIKAIIQPGGSIRDKESVEACNRHGIAMVFTGTRHFKH